LSCRIWKPPSWRSGPLRRTSRPSRISEATKSWQVLPSQIK
jgi:hypothetical protein